MIFDKYIAIIVEKIERHAAIIINEVKDENKILQSEIGALHAKFDDRNELFEKIVKLEEKNLELERENRTLEEATEGVQEEFISVSEKLEEVDKKWESCSRTLLEERNVFEEETEKQRAFIKNAEGMLATAEKAQVEQRTTIAQLEKKVQSSDNALKDAARASTEAQDRLVQAVKAYDKATVSMLNAFIEKKDVTKPRADWEKAKEDLKGWDKPKRKMGRPKKQS